MLGLKRAASRFVNATLHWLSGLYLADNRPGAHPPVFIIGAPRTGSTVFYQALTDNYDVAYIDNLAGRLYGFLALGIALSALLFRWCRHGNYASLHGDTSAGGAHAPSECGPFWYRWLPRDSHFADSRSLDQRQKRHLASEVRRAVAVSRRPFVFKNLNAGQRLQLLLELFPDACVIWCRRQRPFTVQSIIAARHRLGWPVNRLWSVRPNGWQALERLPLVEQVCRQVVNLETQIEQDISRWPAHQRMAVDYETFCANPAESLSRAAAWLNVAPKPGRLQAGTDGGNRVGDPIAFGAIVDLLRAIERGAS